jgi:hypothetical protein
MDNVVLMIDFMNIKNSEIMTISNSYGFKLLSYKMLDKEEFPRILVEGELFEVKKFCLLYYKGDLSEKDFIQTYIFRGDYKLYVASEYVKKLNKLFNHTLVFEIIDECIHNQSSLFRLQLLNVNEAVASFFTILNYNNLIFLLIDALNKPTLKYLKVDDEAEYEQYNNNKIENNLFTIDLDIT